MLIFYQCLSVCHALGLVRAKTARARSRHAKHDGMMPPPPPRRAQPAQPAQTAQQAAELGLVSAALAGGIRAVSSGYSSTTASGRNTQMDLRALSRHYQLTGAMVTVQESKALPGLGRARIIEGYIDKDGKICMKDDPEALSVDAFAKLVHAGANSKAYAAVQVDLPQASSRFPGENGRTIFSLQELRDKHTKVDWRKDLIPLLREANNGRMQIDTYSDAREWNLNTLSPALYQASDSAMQMQQMPIYAYRTLPIGAPTDTGLEFNDRTTLRYDNSTKALDFLQGMHEHIYRGSHSGGKHFPFISATADSGIALWWSGYGLLSVVRIDLKKLVAKRIPQWHVGGAHIELITWPTAHNYAKASQEILFSESVPKSAVTPYDLKWSCKAAYMPPDAKKGEFPTMKEFSLDGIKVLEQLKGSTWPFKVEISNKGSKVPRKYVFKRGCKVGRFTNSNHSCGEFLASLMYSAMGTPLPTLP